MSEEAEVDRSKTKIAVIAAAGAFASAFLGYGISSLVGSPDPGGVFAVLSALVAWAIVVSLQAFLVKSSNIGWWLALLEAAAFFFFLPERASIFALIASAVLAVFIFSAFLKGKFVLANGLKVRFFSTGRAVIGVVMTGLALFTAIYALAFVDFDNLTVPRQAFEYAIKGSEPIVASFIEGFSLEAPVEEVIAAFLRSKPPAGIPEPESVILESAAKLRTDLASWFGVKISAKEKVAEVMYGILESKLKVIPSSIKPFVLGLFAFLAFSIAKTVLFFVGWIIVVFAFLVYQLLLAFNFMHVQLESQSKEVIVVK